jgi:hypothetical protein
LDLLGANSGGDRRRMCGEWGLRASSLQLNPILAPKASQFP